jgi:hypothetical protein
MMLGSLSEMLADAHSLGLELQMDEQEADDGEAVMIIATPASRCHPIVARSMKSRKKNPGHAKGEQRSMLGNDCGRPVVAADKPSVCCFVPLLCRACSLHGTSYHA